MLADYHLHTPLCHHAEGLPTAYAQAALEAGLTEIGLSDHNPMPEPFDEWRMSREDLPRYFELVEEAREAFAGRLTVRLGLECDYLPGGEGWIEELTGLADWDYLIGSVHYLDVDEGWAIDDPDPKWLPRWEGQIEAIWTRYFDRLAACARCGLFDFLAHPDLVKKFGHRPQGDLRRFYEPAVAAIAESGCAIELSTAGLHKPCAQLYPETSFLRLAQEAGIPLLINSDAHRPEEVARDFAVAVRTAREAGYRETLRYKGRTAHAVPLPEVWPTAKG